MKPSEWQDELADIILDFGSENEILLYDMYEFLLKFSTAFINSDCDEEDAREICKYYYKLLVDILEFRKIGKK